VSVVAFLAIAAGFAGLALLTRRLALVSAAIGITGLAAAAIAAVAILPGDGIVVGGMALAGSAYLRLFLLLGSVVGLLLALVGLATTWPRELPAATLLVLLASGTALAIPDPVVGVLALTAGGMVTALVAVATTDGTPRRAIAQGEIQTAAIAGAIIVGAVAVFTPPSPMAAAFGVVFLAVAAGVALRLGAIPFHVRVARMPGAGLGLSMPLVLIWGPAAFALLALALTDPSVMRPGLQPGLERVVVAGVGALCLVLGIVAAMVHEDLDRIVAYSIVADAGVVLLAIASFDSTAWAPAHTWLLAFVVSKSAFAAWAAAMRWTFGTVRIGSLSGWCGRAPLLGVALAVIAAATVGWPGLAMYDARGAIFVLALGDGPGLALTLAALGAIAYFGRILVVGLGARSPTVAAAGTSGPGRTTGDAGTPARLISLSRVTLLSGTHRGTLAGIGVGVLAVLAITVAAGGMGVVDAAAAPLR
jgi:NADH-quinone oxidoreductase subunit N